MRSAVQEVIMIKAQRSIFSNAGRWRVDLASNTAQ